MPPTETPSEESSLDRYLESRAGYLLGHANARRGLVIMGMVGAICLLLAAVIVAVSLITTNPDAIAGAIGPFIAGTVNLTLSRKLRRRMTPAVETDAELTPQARSFMADLMKEVFGWSYAWGSTDPRPIWSGGTSSPHMRKRDRRAWRRMYSRGSWGKRERSAKEVLHPAAFEALDQAAYHYNRMAGLLATGNPAFTKFAPTVKAAADQAMADMFDTAAVLDNFPESSAPQSKAGEQIDELKELADRLETMEASGVNAVEAGSRIQTVLEELRLDQLARSELTQPAEEPQTQKLQG